MIYFRRVFKVLGCFRINIGELMKDVKRVIQKIIMAVFGEKESD